VRVNKVTASVFRKYRSADDYAKTHLDQLEQEIKPTGFYKQKAKTLKSLGHVLSERFNGQVPRRMEDLVTLPGVGRKTANVILGTAFGIPLPKSGRSLKQ